MNLQQFVNKTCNKTVQINKVPTKSSKKTLARKTINKLLNEHPEWQDLLLSLVCYPIQVWASDCRNKLNFNLINELALDNASVMGITNKEVIKRQIKLNKSTNRIICFIGSSLRQISMNDKDCEILGIIHGNIEKEITNYRFVREYENALIKFCKKYNDEFKKMYKKIQDEFEKIDDDNQYTYNNTDLLLKLKKKLKYLVANEINTGEALKQINLCIKQLDSFIMNGKDMSKVIKMYSDGKTEENIMQELNKSRVYVRDRKHEGIKALSYIIWGYSTKNILNNLK